MSGVWVQLPFIPGSLTIIEWTGTVAAVFDHSATNCLVLTQASCTFNSRASFTGRENAFILSLPFGADTKHGTMYSAARKKTSPFFPMYSYQVLFANARARDVSHCDVDLMCLCVSI